MKSLTLFLVVLQIFDWTIAYPQLCESSMCKPGQQHIGCRNPFILGKECETNAIIVSMNRKLIKTIVYAHNEMRNQVAHGFNGFAVAARMGTMTWSEDLSELAELNVRQCVLKPSKCFAIQQFRNPGQNLAYSKFKDQQSIDKVVRSQIRMWFEEYQVFTPGSLKTIEEKECEEGSHFLQIVRDRADKIGCGVLLQRKHNYTYQFLVCKYSVSPPKSELTYKHGEVAGDGCKTGTNKQYANLCSTNEVYNPHIIDDKDAETEPEVPVKITEDVPSNEKYEKNKEAISDVTSGMQENNTKGNENITMEMYRAENMVLDNLSLQIQNISEMTNATNLSEPNITVKSFP